MKFQLPPKAPILNPDFIFGTATAAFQIEGGHNVDGKTPSIWDTYCATPGKIADGSNGHIACDHYHLWEDDINLLASLNVDAYRFSIAWSRIIPDASGKINQAGLDFYEKIIDRLLALNIKPFVTLYHWDLPQYLMDRGGWLNRDTVQAFVKYAEVVSQYFGEKIFSYATFNEPWCSSFLSYDLGIHAPGLKDKSKAFQVAHHILLAHGLSIPVLKKNAPNSQHGIVLNFEPAYAATHDENDKKAVEYSDGEYFHWFLKPLMQKKYPDVVTTNNTERLPDISEEDLDAISTPIDFLGINYYTRRVVKHTDPNDITAYEIIPHDPAECTTMGWEVYPDGLFELLKSLNQTYDLPPIYITENGAAFDDQLINGIVDDPKRVSYFQNHLNAVNNAMETGVDIKGYFAWSLMDNFEWAEGYRKRFGIVYVDYPTQKRVIKNSGLAWQHFLGNRRG